MTRPRPRLHLVFDGLDGGRERVSGLRDCNDRFGKYMRLCFELSESSFILDALGVAVRDVFCDGTNNRRQLRVREFASGALHESHGRRFCVTGWIAGSSPSSANCPKAPNPAKLLLLQHFSSGRVAQR